MDKDKKYRVDKLFAGAVSEKEMAGILFEIANDPQMEEYVVTRKRVNYMEEMEADYGSFIPASSMAADDGTNLCDFECEQFVLKSLGVDIEEHSLVKEAKMNYWLTDLGTPLYNMGKLMERNGLYVERTYDGCIDDLVTALREFKVIVVVNGNLLSGENDDMPDFCREANPNHAVVVLSVTKEDGKVILFNPANDKVGEYSLYDLDLFVRAWHDSRNYMVKARIKKDLYEYNPQPMDLSSISINEELEQLIEMISAEVHDVWARDKKIKVPGIKYAPVNEDGSDKENCSHFLLPYEMMSDEDKDNDRKMVLQTIKLLKRLGYRLVNINNMHKCPVCDSGIEPDNNYCSCCGRKLEWKDFR